MTPSIRKTAIRKKAIVVNIAATPLAVPLDGHSSPLCGHEKGGTALFKDGFVDEWLTLAPLAPLHGP